VQLLTAISACPNPSARSIYCMAQIQVAYKLRIKWGLCPVLCAGYV